MDEEEEIEQDITEIDFSDPGDIEPAANFMPRLGESNAPSDDFVGPYYEDENPTLSLQQAIGTQDPYYDFYQAEGEDPGTVDQYDMAHYLAGLPSIAEQSTLDDYQAPELESVVPKTKQRIWALQEALGTSNPDLNVRGDDIITLEDIIAASQGEIPFGEFYETYGVTPEEVLDSDSYAGELPTSGIGSLSYLFGPDDPPPFVEKVFIEGERDPFRQDWSEGYLARWDNSSGAPYYYNVDEMSEADQDLYRNSEQYLSKIGDEAVEAGFDSISQYLVHLSQTDPVQFEYQRDLYNYFAPVYEELGPTYRFLQQQEFQEGLVSEEMREYLTSPQGSKEIIRSIAYLSAAAGIDPSMISQRDIEVLLNEIGTGGLADLIAFASGGGGTGGTGGTGTVGAPTGPSFSIRTGGGGDVVADPIEPIPAPDPIADPPPATPDSPAPPPFSFTVQDPAENYVIADNEGNDVFSIGFNEDGDLEITDPGGGPIDTEDVGNGIVVTDEDGGQTLVEFDGDTNGITLTNLGQDNSAQQQEQLNDDMFFAYNDIGGYESLGVNIIGGGVNPDALPGGSGLYGISFGDFRFNRERDFGINNSAEALMGYNPISDYVNWSEEGVSAGEYVNGISNYSSETAMWGGVDSVGQVQYPAFLVEAANNREPYLMAASGGDPFAWWESLGQMDRENFIAAYDRGDNPTMVSIDDPTADLYRRDESGRAAEYLMPRWMLLEQGENLDYRQWHNLSAEERNRLQSVVPLLNLGGEDISSEELQELVVVMRDTDDGVETLNRNVEGDYFFGSPGISGVEYVSPPAPMDNRLTFGEYIQAVIDQGFTTDSYNDNAALGELSGVARESVTAGGTFGAEGDASWNAFNRQPEKPIGYGAPPSLGNPWGGDWREHWRGGGPGWHSADQNNIMPQGLLVHIANNIDQFMVDQSLTGDPEAAYYVPLDPTVGESNATFDVSTWDHQRDYRYGDSATWSFLAEDGNRYEWDDLYEQDFDPGNDLILESMDLAATEAGDSGQRSNYLTELDQIETGIDLGEAVNLSFVNWNQYLGTYGLWDNQTALDEGVITEVDWDKAGVDDGGNWAIPFGAWEGSSDNEGRNFQGVHEIMAQLGRGYAAYTNSLENQEVATLDKESFYDTQKQAQQSAIGYNEIENLAEKAARDREIMAVIDNLWLNAVTEAQGRAASDPLRAYYDGMGANSFAEGGPVGMPEAPTEELLQVAMAVSDPGYPNRDMIIAMGMKKYGPDLIAQIVSLLGGPGSQPLPPPDSGMPQGPPTYEFASGGYVPGAHGGMDDTIPAVTDGSQPAKLSSGEFVVPADVVSGLGDGNNQNGAHKLYDMMDRIRSFKTGAVQQPPPIVDSKVLPG